LANNKKLNVSLNLNIRGMAPSATLAINEISRLRAREGREVFRFGLGQSPFPVPDPVVRELQANAFQKDYLPVKGLPELREAVASYLGRSQRLSRSGADVLIGPGSKELMFILQLVYYGELVIPRPSWVSYAPQANIIGRKVTWVPTKRENDWHLMPEDLMRVCAEDPEKPRLVILNYPSNPTGSTYRTEDLRDLARVARAHKVVLLSDEIYGELHHKGQHVSIARYYPEGTVVSGGLSKWCGAGGWRLGTFSFPSELRWLLDAMAVVASETFTSTSAPIQYAAIRAYEGGDEIGSYLQRCRRILGALGRRCSRTLTDAGVDVTRPKGAFYLFLDFGARADRLGKSGIESGKDLCRALLEETGVALLPGCDFGRPAEELTARLSYVDFDGADALDAVERLGKEQTLNGEFLQEHCPRVLEGMVRICNWLGAR
jgi:aspartate aminotransferase